MKAFDTGKYPLRNILFSSKIPFYEIDERKRRSEKIER